MKTCLLSLELVGLGNENQLAHHTDGHDEVIIGGARPSDETMSSVCAMKLR